MRALSVRTRLRVQRYEEFLGLQKNKNKIIQNYTKFFRVALFPRGIKDTKNFWDNKILRTKFLKIKQNYLFIAECTVSSGADRSDRREEKKVRRKFEITKKIEQRASSIINGMAYYSFYRGSIRFSVMACNGLNISPLGERFR